MPALNPADSNSSPFNLDDPASYREWRERKLDRYPKHAEDLVVEIRDPGALSQAERAEILERCNKSNMAIYAGPTGADPDKQIPATLAAQFGLRHLDRNMGADDDGITKLQVVNGQWRNRYIPYTDRPIHWHTDGYYNGLDQQIHALLLHCVRPADDGGENALLDHEIAYLRLRDMNPDYISALMAPDVMTIPANVVDDTVLRPERSGPVFSIRGKDRLHMRYTARTHNVIWKEDATTRDAVAALCKVLTQPDPLIHQLKLQSGWGLISNNVLHNRSRFNDGGRESRLLYRLRYYESIND
jgi:hypothetical protein